ncbi:BlaI/MecI/CopY family transcriptional regulator [Galbitalea soli]|uniref:BlaI/MecI/CopY family transcriptional regulator n=1 Tax=Galbitalea soli TaxID=1268042 RepID=A0A7C9PKF4_9MICO|nr:BlaI/MecI/CopY family transcriptional regulator [Galbitalea soli]NEM89765.1 BlaI/MecI/CopY family transcriptional regulator [Galbitalea soli]NYJ30467.1 putative transcriptional regulator [Galbitalea soli]
MATTLGELERSVMEFLWASDEAMTAYDLRDRLAAAEVDRSPAITTVLTVLSRLENKGFVQRQRTSRPHLYRAQASREDHMAELMHEVLGSATNRSAVLERFVGQVSEREAALLRELLESRSHR